MRTIEKYIVREIINPFAIVVFVLVGFFACFSSARYLAKAVTETLGVSIMLKLILLKTLIALEVLLPIAFYASVFIGLSRLHRDQEIIALHAGGVGAYRIVNAVLILAVPIAMIIGTLSIFGRPWAYETSYILSASANAELNTDRFQAGRFYGNEDSGRVIYVKEKEPSNDQMQKVFQYRNKDGSSEIIMAREAYRQRPVSNELPELHLRDGIMYQLKNKDTMDSTDSIVHFSKLVLYLNEDVDALDYKRKATATSVLLKSDRPADIAELEWRLSRPIATILLALVAIPLSRSSPRQGRGGKIFSATLVFAVYYNLTGLAQTWVEQGLVDRFPGVWWLHGLMFLLVARLLLPEFREYLSRGR